MKINLRFTNKAQEVMEVDGGLTLSQLQDLITLTFPAHIKETSYVKKLIHSGKVLKNDSLTLVQAGISDGDLIVPFAVPKKKLKKTCGKSVTSDETKTSSDERVDDLSAVGQAPQKSSEDPEPKTDTSVSSSTPVSTTTTTTTPVTTPAPEPDSTPASVPPTQPPAQDQPMVNIPDVGPVPVDQVFELMATQMVSNPDAMRQTLMGSGFFQALHKTHPEMSDVLIKDKDFAKELLTSEVLSFGGLPMPSGSAPAAPSVPAAPAAPSLSPEDAEAIAQLEALCPAASKRTVVECYFASGKNLDIAAAMLFQGGV